MRKKPLATRVRAMQSLKQALGAFLERQDAAERLVLQPLWVHWRMVMGPDLSALAAPLGHRGDTLLLGTEDPMAAQEAHMQAGEILERVNAFLEAPRFKRVQVGQMMDRQNLALLPSPPEEAPPPPPRPEPEGVGSLLGALDPESPVGRAYQAYVDYFAVRRQDRNPRPDATGAC